MEKEQLKKLQKLSTEEKIEVAQMLWDDISKNENELDIPDEHKRILDQRLNKIQQGEGKYHSWENIRKKYSTK